MGLKDDLEKATPGPWAYEKADGSLVWGSPDVLTVARFHCGRNDHGNDARPSKANARLISRAPDMAAALIEAEAALAETTDLVAALTSSTIRIRGQYVDVREAHVRACAALTRIREVTEC